VSNKTSYQPPAPSSQQEAGSGKPKAASEACVLTNPEILEFKKEVDKITRARTPMQLKYIVVGRFEDRIQQYKQICIEADAKYTALRSAEYGRQKALLDLEELEIKLEFENAKAHMMTTTSDSARRLAEIAARRIEIDIQDKKNSLELLASAMDGALKELLDLMHFARTEYTDLKDKSEEDLIKEGEENYWKSRLSRQIQIDLATIGKISAGNLDFLLKLPEQMQSEVLVSAALKQDVHLKLMGQVDRKHRALVAPETREVNAEKVIGKIKHI
jgi:hypothetical protein